MAKLVMESGYIVWAAVTGAHSVGGRSYPTSKEWWLRGCRMA